MLVRLAYGRHAGEVVDLLPLSARAMLADGRAVLPETEPVTPAAALVSEQVTARSDRGLPKHKRRATR